MSDYHKQTEFLRQCIRYNDDTAEHEELERQIKELQRTERCLRRAVWLMALCAGLAFCGLCYGTLFFAEFPLDLAQFRALFFVKIPSALGVGSMACLVGFACFGVVNRRELDQRREDCRRLTTKLMEARLGKPLELLVRAADQAARGRAPEYLQRLLDRDEACGEGATPLRDAAPSTDGSGAALSRDTA